MLLAVKYNDPKSTPILCVFRCVEDERRKVWRWKGMCEQKVRRKQQLRRENSKAEQNR